MTPRMKEFLEQVDKLCWDYKYEIKPTHPVPDGEYPSISIFGDDGEVIKLLYIDGEGIGVGSDL